jgi:hypothetical protein
MRHHIPHVSEDITINVKGKAIPLQAWTGPEVSRRLRLPDFTIKVHPYILN